MNLDRVLLRPTFTCFCITSLPPGTQWSQKPIDIFPAAPAVRICTSGSTVLAAPSFNAVRRVTLLGLRIKPFPGQSIGCVT